MKQVCVIGLGQFGSHLARKLARMNCEVLAIDKSDKIINDIRDDVQQVVITDVRNLEALKSVLVPDIDEVIVSLGGSMEASILCTLHLQKIGIKRIRAKASTQDHAAILRAVGATDIIFPEQETAERMAQRIVNPDMLDYLPLSEEYSVVEISLPKNFINQSLTQLDLRKKYGILVIAVKTPEAHQIQFMPIAESILKKGNTLVVMGKEADIKKLRKSD
ncbi:MAG: TrkA family potassium uptake protein [Planctomycetota bacterium]|nr:MAG: TrkA family potassium uptake protein [Planctomycetota bacterium]